MICAARAAASGRRRAGAPRFRRAEVSAIAAAVVPRS